MASDFLAELGAEPGVPFRLGIMGGTFDPIHVAHLACAEQARVELRLDKVLFIPTGCPVFKKKQKVTDGRSRLEMCRLAVESNPFFLVSDMEVTREGDTFAVDTLKVLRRLLPDSVELVYITGSDTLASVLKWKDSESVAGLAEFAAAMRPGFELGKALRESLAAAGFSVRYFEPTSLGVSSSAIREKIAEGGSVRYLVPDAVFDYMNDRELYSIEGR